MQAAQYPPNMPRDERWNRHQGRQGEMNMAGGSIPPPSMYPPMNPNSNPNPNHVTQQQMAQDMQYSPEPRVKPPSRGNIRMINPDQQQVNQSIRNQRPRTPPEEYFPFGRAGAGAPHRDSFGNIIAARPPRLNENDPKFLNPGEFYKQFQGGYESVASIPNPSQYPPEPYIPYQNSQQAVYEQPPEILPPAPQSNYPENTYLPPENAFPGNELPQPNGDDPARLQKLELARALENQIEEKRRKREEEKRQRILEERLEEERLERQRKEMEEEARREAEKKKQQYQAAQNFNNNVVVVAEPKKRRVRTPIDFNPPPQPQNQPQFQPQAQKPPVRNEEVVNKFQSHVNSELSQLRQEMKAQYSQLNQELSRVKEETREANDQKIEAQRELEMLKEEIKKQQVIEEAKKKEFYETVINNQMPPPFPKTRMPPPDKNPLQLKRGFNDVSLSFDFASKSLTGESKFIPLTKPEPLHPPFKPQVPANRYATELDSVFPSLPDVNMPMESVKTANSSIGLERLHKKNDAKLQALTKIESADEVSKLDDLLMRYLDSGMPKIDEEI